MSQTPRVSRSTDASRETIDIASSIDSATLLKGQRELLIRHGAETYRLRITASNKLILTK
jgi:hemin uptake protein HemP